MVDPKGVDGVANVVEVPGVNIEVEDVERVVADFVAGEAEGGVVKDEVEGVDVKGVEGVEGVELKGEEKATGVEGAGPMEREVEDPKLKEEAELEGEKEKAGAEEGGGACLCEPLGATFAMTLPGIGLSCGAGAAKAGAFARFDACAASPYLATSFSCSYSSSSSSSSLNNS